MENGFTEKRQAYLILFRERENALAVSVQEVKRVSDLLAALVLLFVGDGLPFISVGDQGKCLKSGMNGCKIGLLLRLECCF